LKIFTENLIFFQPNHSRKNQLQTRQKPPPSSISVDPKTAPPFSFRAPVGLMETFAIQLRVLARILDHDEEISIRARYAEENLLIVPFFPNSPDFRCTEISKPGQIAQNGLCFAKKAHFKMRWVYSRGVLPGVVSSDVKCCQERSGDGVRDPAGFGDQGTRPK
jgi:hypothetical protein